MSVAGAHVGQVFFHVFEESVSLCTVIPGKVSVVLAGVFFTPEKVKEFSFNKVVHFTFLLFPGLNVIRNKQ